uniref:FBA_2 domain-containing protein n=1 Tax=Caenorhabditis tropicalis TaxID=1561998 RepID=A0A1I7T3S1_9PELO
MNSKPMTYDSLKTVIQYLDPNTRLLLSSRIPSIRFVEKAVPLKLESLEIGTHWIIVNGTSYFYGIYKIDNEDKRPYEVSGYTPYDRYICDVDGFVTSKKEQTIFEKLKSMIFGNKSSNNDFPRFEIHLRKQRKNLRVYLIERISYTGDFHKAEESLREFMFGKRRHFVVVNKYFMINQNCPIPIPCGLKIRTKQLMINNKISTNLELIKPVIDESCLPFEKLSLIVNWSNDTQEIDYEFIKNCKLLKYYYISELQLPQILVLPNQRIYFSTSSYSFLPKEDFILLIKNWIETNKPIDTCFTFRISLFSESYLIELLNHVKESFHQATTGDKCVNIPIRNSTILKISYKQDKHSYYFIEMAVVRTE